MAELGLALTYVLHWEDPKMTGVIVVDNNGALVRYGINKKFHPNVDARFWSAATMGRAEALLTAKEIYVTEYWMPLHGNELVDQDVANKLLDMAVNQGVVTAIRQVQKVAKTWGKKIEVDGKFGPITLAAVNELNPQQALAGLRKEWEIRFEMVLELHPEWESSRDNWTKRANA